MERLRRLYNHLVCAEKLLPEELRKSWIGGHLRKMMAEILPLLNKKRAEAGLPPHPPK